MALGVALGLAALAVGTAVFRRRLYGRLFTYERSASQSYDFAASEATVAGVDLSSEGFAWPAALDACSAAFLELNVASTLLGAWCDPWLEFSSGNVAGRQYLERGARGSRYLNLSALAALPAGAWVRLAGHFVSWPAQRARLLGFHTPLSAQPRVLVAAPHPDDAEIAAFALYRQADAGIVTITAGEHGGFLQKQMPEIAARVRATAQMRAWDAITVPQLGGAPPERAVCLAYPDSLLPALAARPDVPAKDDSLDLETRRGLRRLNLSSLVASDVSSFTWNNLVGELRAIIEKLRPEIIVAPHPFLDTHWDHGFTTMAICEALLASGLMEGQLFLHVTHTTQTQLWPFGETDGVVSLPPHFGGLAPFQAIHSLAVDAETQRLKLLAIDAMHDLRTMPSLAEPGWAAILRGGFAELRGKIAGLRRDPSSFQRRAPRPNELFFVLPYRAAEKLRADFLGRKE